MPCFKNIRKKDSCLNYKLKYFIINIFIKNLFNNNNLILPFIKYNNNIIDFNISNNYKLFNNNAFKFLNKKKDIIIINNI